MMTEKEAWIMIRDAFKRYAETGEDGYMTASEDGELMSIAVAFSPDWPDKLKSKIESLRRVFKPERIKRRFAYRKWAESGYFFFNGDKGKVWRIGDTPTAFVVYEYQLYDPQL